MADSGGSPDVHVKELLLPPDKAFVYKVVGSEPDLKEYNELRRAARLGARETEGTEKDWTAMYTQFRVSHALGTVPYRWDQRGADGQPYTSASLLEARFMEPLPVVVAHGALFADGAVEGSVKAQVVKEHLGLNVEEPLMKQLGAQGKALLMQETEDLILWFGLISGGPLMMVLFNFEDEWELIFNHQHLAALENQTRVVATFKKSPARPVTGSWETPDEGPMKYADDELVMETLRDLGEILREAARFSMASNGDYDLQQLRPCLEALGVWIYSTEEWSEVEKIFTARQGDRPPVRKPTAPKSPARVLSKLWSGPDGVSGLAAEHHLTQEQVEDFRADLVGLDFLFRKHNRYGNRYLNENEVLELLVACGADARLLCTELVSCAQVPWLPTSGY
eukprot:s3582_g2.t1